MPVPPPERDLYPTANLSKRTRVPAEAFSKQCLSVSMWAENVDRPSESAWLSPMSARTLWKKSTREEERQGKGIPCSRKESGQRQALESDFVLPPALGPVSTNPGASESRLKSLATTIDSVRLNKGCLASTRSMHPSSLHLGNLSTNSNAQTQPAAGRVASQPPTSQDGLTLLSDFLRELLSDCELFS